MEQEIEFFRQVFKKQVNWDMQDHYIMVPTFRLPEDFADRYKGAWLEVVAGNIVLPSMLRLKVNGNVLDLWPEGEFTNTRQWTQSRAWEYVIKLRVPNALLRAGKNTLRVATHMLPGLERELRSAKSEAGLGVEIKAQNISVSGISLEMIAR